MRDGEDMETYKQLLESLDRLSQAQLTVQDRAEILGRLDQRMSDSEQSSRSRSRRHRIRGAVVWAAAGITAAGAASFLLLNTSWNLPSGDSNSGDKPHLTVPFGKSITPPGVTDPQYNEQRALVQKMFNLAKEGLVLDCKFAADKSMIDQIKQEWGDPAHEGAAGKGIYATYPQRGFDFGFNKGAQVFDVRSYTPAIKQIRYSTVRAVLGEPAQVNYYADPKQHILIYKAGDLYELQFIFPEPTAELIDPTLDHISVFCPKDATPNSMAQ